MLNLLVEVNTPGVFKLARDGQFGAQTCKICDSGHPTCAGVQIQSHIPYMGVSDAWLPAVSNRWRSAQRVFAQNPIAFFICEKLTTGGSHLSIYSEI